MKDFLELVNKIKQLTLDASSIADVLVNLMDIGKLLCSAVAKYQINKNEEIAIDNLPEDIDEIMREAYIEIIQQNSVEVGKNYDIFTDKHIQRIADQVVKKFNIYIREDEMRRFVKEFLDKQLELLAKNADEKSILNAVIGLYHKIETSQDESKNEILKSIKDACDKLQDSIENKKMYRGDEQFTLPFEINNLFYTVELEKKDNQNKTRDDFQNKLIIEISDRNYKIDVNCLYTMIESNTQRLVFDQLWNSFFYKGESGKLEVDFSSRKCGLKSVKNFYVCGLFTIYNRQNYYIRVFGDQSALYYEPITYEEYKTMRDKYEKAFRSADSGEEFGTYYNLLFAADFTR